MKPLSRNREEGGTLVVTLVMAITIGTVLGAYLSLIGNRYELTMRSQCWNSAVPVLEAGIEEALTHLQDDASKPAASGWTSGVVGGQQVYWKQRSLTDGCYYYPVIYNAASTSPYIYSTGFVPAPRHRNTYISRTVKVSGVYPPQFRVAFAAIYNIKMNGNGLTANSFNSALPSLSTNGRYDPKKTSTNGSVASVYGPVNLGNHSIAGDLYVGPTVATNNIGSGQVSGQVRTDFNVSYPDAKLPANAAWQNAPAAVKVGKTLVRDFKTSGDYIVSDATDITIEPGVTVRLQVTSTSFNPDNIHVVAKNGVSGSLEIYQLSGNGTINNITLDSGRARNFYYYGLPGVTTITYGGSSTFTGVIYAPQADFKLNGGGNNIGFIGASVTKTITMGGHFDFHFDEDLLSSAPSGPLTITSWQEL